MATTPPAPPPASSSTSRVHISRHPCLRAKLSQLRSEATGSQDTKRLVHEIAIVLACEALADLEVADSGTDSSPLGYQYTTHSLVPSPTRISIVPILRSGLSMVDALTTVLPAATSIHHLGMYREKTTFQPVEYYNNLPYHGSGTHHEDVSELAIVLDPVIATGATICAAIDTLRDWGVRRIVTISILAAKDGLERAAEQWPEGVDMWVGGVDDETDARGMIKPGLGDIGDRLFLTVGK